MHKHINLVLCLAYYFFADQGNHLLRPDSLTPIQLSVRSEFYLDSYHLAVVISQLMDIMQHII